MSRSLNDLFLSPRKAAGDDSDSVVSLVRQWADREIIAKRLDYQQKYHDLFPEKTRLLALSMGLQKLVLTEAAGGFGWDAPQKAPAVAHVLCEASRADASAGTLLAMNYASLLSLGQSPDFQEPFLEDRLTTVSVILPGAGYAGIETPLFKGRSILAEARTGAGGFILRGKNLRPLAGGLQADLFCTVCSDADGRPCLAFSEGSAKGTSRSPLIKTTGLNALANAEVTFHDVAVPEGRLVSTPGAVEKLYTWLNLLLGGVSLGAGLNFFEILSSWSDTRTIKGSSLLKENPLCASVLADVAEELACAQLLLDDLALLMSSPEGWDRPDSSGLFTYAVMIGGRVQQAVLKAINRGMELMGSAGYAKEWHAEKHWRDVKTLQSLLCGVAAEAPAKMDTARFFFACTEI